MASLAGLCALPLLPSDQRLGIGVVTAFVLAVTLLSEVGRERLKVILVLATGLGGSLSITMLMHDTAARLVVWLAVFFALVIALVPHQDSN